MIMYSQSMVIDSSNNVILHITAWIICKHINFMYRSVGATVIEMITGEHPYPSYEPLTVVYTLGSDKHYKTPFDVCKIQEPDQQMVTFLSHCFQRLV